MSNRISCNKDLYKHRSYLNDLTSLISKGRWKNLRFVLTATCMPNGDGIDWPLREGTFKYDLTVSVI